MRSSERKKFSCPFPVAQVDPNTEGGWAVVADAIEELYSLIGSRGINEQNLDEATANKIQGTLISWVPSTTFTSNFSASGYYSLIGKIAMFTFYGTCTGTPGPAATNFEIVPPPGVRIDTVALKTLAIQAMVGGGYIRDASVAAIRQLHVQWPGSGSSPETGRFRPMQAATAASPAAVTIASPFTLAIDDAIALTWWAPIL